jgi:hypothetical protein
MDWGGHAPFFSSTASVGLLIPAAILHLGKRPVFGNGNGFFPRIGAEKLAGSVAALGGLASPTIGFNWIVILFWIYLGFCAFVSLALHVAGSDLMAIKNEL